MTYEEALNKPLIGFRKDNKDYYELSDEWIDVVDKALEKQIRKKPMVINYRGKRIPYCPACKALLVKYADEDYREIFGEDWDYMNYCDICGQHIDWKE